MSPFRLSGGGLRRQGEQSRRAPAAIRLQTRIVEINPFMGCGVATVGRTSQLQRPGFVPAKFHLSAAEFSLTQKAHPSVVQAFPAPPRIGPPQDFETLSQRNVIRIELLLHTDKIVFREPNVYRRGGEARGRGKSEERSGSARLRAVTGQFSTDTRGGRASDCRVAPH
jgi:hypothetical protein